MNKLITLLCLLCPFAVFSQTDTLLYQNFNVDPTASFLTFNNGNDTTWVDMDADALTDANGLPGNWFWSDTAFASVDHTGCLESSSWFASPGKALNYLMTPPLQIVDANAVLHWSTAPFQTPYYCDGYQVVVSTTTNSESDFTDTIFVAAEYLSGSSAGAGDYSLYTFSPGFVHGQDGTYWEDSGDPSAHFGVLRPFTASLAAYAGKTIYIAFLHGSFDDNLIALDDIAVTGTLATGIAQNSKDTKFNLFPNPASSSIQLSYNLPGTAPVTARILDSKGTLIRSEYVGTQIAGNQKSTLDVSKLPAGNYVLELIAGGKYTKSSFVVAR